MQYTLIMNLKIFSMRTCICVVNKAMSSSPFEPGTYPGDWKRTGYYRLSIRAAENVISNTLQHDTGMNIPRSDSTSLSRSPCRWIILLETVYVYITRRKPHIARKEIASPLCSKEWITSILGKSKRDTSRIFPNRLLLALQSGDAKVF